MQNSILRFLILLFAIFNVAKAQNIDNVTSLREIGSAKGVRLFYDNDFFTAQDYYYTQGINIEILLPALKKNPLNHLLVKTGNSEKVYGVSIEHNVFTPSSIRHDEILYGDHPYSALLLLKSFVRTKNAINGNVMSSSISLGFIGPAAFGKQMQTSIHSWLKNLLPLGWDHQLRNNFIINYQLNYEKQFIHSEKHFIFSGIAGVNAGTLTDNVRAGLQFRAGIIQEPQEERNFELIFYARGIFSCELYNATLSGGVFNRKNEYALPASDIERFTFHEVAGLNMRVGRTILEYYLSISSKEFKNGMLHRYGGISLGYNF